MEYSPHHQAPAVGVDGALLQLLENYLRARHLKPVRADVPQGSCLGPLLWNVLHLVPAAKAFADDITLSHSYGLEEAAATRDVNATLSRIAAWGRKWQVKFAAHITRKSEALCLAFNRETLTPREEEVLGDPLGATSQRGLREAGIPEENLLPSGCQRTGVALQGAGLLLLGIRLPCLGRRGQQTSLALLDKKVQDRRGSSERVSSASTLHCTPSNTSGTWRASHRHVQGAAAEGGSPAGTPAACPTGRDCHQSRHPCPWGAAPAQVQNVAPTKACVAVQTSVEDCWSTQQFKCTVAATDRQAGFRIECINCDFFSLILY
ncbi:hypothetical protein E2C01_082131 [Portunus trituberculatus]|uniref:Reverse transcriptase domain-containing protein n=1 Tax=Portunus trituberculatus TaxID=210409 RepID=A0A5B7IYD9_PORTR|nr:hypothetical protein [Portunus trituberculatus]